MSSDESIKQVAEILTPLFDNRVLKGKEITEVLMAAMQDIKEIVKKELLETEGNNAKG